MKTLTHVNLLIALAIKILNTIRSMTYLAFAINWVDEEEGGRSSTKRRDFKAGILGTKNDVVFGGLLKKNYIKHLKRCRST